MKAITWTGGTFPDPVDTCYASISSSSGGTITSQGRCCSFGARDNFINYEQSTGPVTGPQTQYPVNGASPIVGCGG